MNFIDFEEALSASRLDTRRDWTEAKRELDVAKERPLRLVLDDMAKDGTSWLGRWSFAGLPCDGITGQPLRGRNALLVWSQMREMHAVDLRFLTASDARRYDALDQGDGAAEVTVAERRVPRLYVGGEPVRPQEQPGPGDAAAWAGLVERPDVEVRREPVALPLVNVKECLNELSLAMPWKGHPFAHLDTCDKFNALIDCPWEIHDDLARDDTPYFDRETATIMTPPMEWFMSDEDLHAAILRQEVAAALPRRPGAGNGWSPREAMLDELACDLGCAYLAAQFGIDLSRVNDPRWCGGSQAWEAELREWAHNPAAGIDGPGAAEGLLGAMDRATKACDWLSRRCFDHHAGIERTAGEIELAYDLETVREGSGAPTKEESL